MTMNARRPRHILPIGGHPAQACRPGSAPPPSTSTRATAMKHALPAALGIPSGALVCAYLLCIPADAWADAPSRIASVKVYPGSATVERVAHIPAGSRSYTFQCLPQGLDAASLQVSADAAVRIGESSVQVQDRDIASSAGGCASPLDERWRQAQDEVASARAEVQALELAQSYLKATAAGAPDGKAPPAPALIASTTEALRRGMQDNLQRQYQAQRRLKAAELTLKAVGAERDRLAGPRARVSTVTVTLATERDADLRLSYQVHGPGWAPSYRATLDSTTATVRLERLALVAQATGEDWSGVALTLSTGQPARATAGGLPRPWRLDVAPPPLPAAPAPAPAYAAAAAPAALARSQPLAEAAPEPLPSFDVGVLDTAYATEFSVPQRITVPSGGPRVTLALGQQEVRAQLLTRAVPAVEEAAYLVAQFVAPAGVWPAAAVALYRDGAFVGNGRLDGAELARTGLSFGRDERVLVRAEAPREHSASAGLTGATTERQVERAYTVENRHDKPIALQVLDAAPVSQNEQISVQSRYDPPPADSAWNQQAGTIAWSQTLAAGASARFGARHTIRHAKDLRLQERR